jgi:hypothetical protein
MFVIFYVDVIICQIFNLVTWYASMVHIISNDMLQYTFNHKNKNHLNFFWSILCFSIHRYITFIFTNIFQSPTYKMKWNSFFSNILPRLYSNIICKNIVKIFQKFEMGYTQTCTSLESSTMWHPKGGHHIVFFPWNNVLLFQVPLCHQRVHD